MQGLSDKSSKTIEELHEHYFGKKEPSMTDIMCPITGSPLMYIPDQRMMGVMDPDSIYESSTDPSVRFARHPFSYNTFRLIDKYEDDLGRYFILSDDQNEWTEYKKVPGISGIISIDTPQSEIDELIVKENLEKAERNKRYEEQVANGEIIPLPFTKVFATTQSFDLVKIAPMAPPTGISFFC